MKTVLSFLLLVLIVSTANGKYTGPLDDVGLQFLKDRENRNFNPNYHYDTKGIKTIGYGHNCEARKGCERNQVNRKYPVPISKEDANKLLNDDLAWEISCVNRHITYKNLNANQFSALVSFTYNRGCEGMRQSDLRKKLNKNDVKGASKVFAEYNKECKTVKKIKKCKVNKGLINRREMERALFCSGGVC